jgi:putative transcription factor
MPYDPNQQDWDSVQWNKKPQKNKSSLIAQSGEVETFHKTKHSPHDDKLRKIENSEETSHTKVSFSMKMKIQKARMEKKMTQKELAQSIQVKPQVINEYESGKAIPDSGIINKLQRVLGKKLR